MPNCAPIISAATSSSSATDAVMRNADRMPGRAAGSTTLRRMAKAGTSKLCAMRMMPRGTLSIAPKVAMQVGKNTPSATTVTLDVSPMPSHRMNSGSSAILGTG